MKRKFRPHQSECFRYCREQNHPAVFMQMRLGKTLVVIRRVQMYKPRGRFLRVLVVAPNSALGSWEKELKTEGVRFINASGLEPQTKTDALHCPFWILINKEAHLQVGRYMRHQHWDAVILDESTFIKNVRASRTKLVDGSTKPAGPVQVTSFFLNNFRSVPHRWIMTGRPNPQSDLELWSQLAFLDGTAFGCRSYWEFRSRFFKQKRTGHGWKPKTGTQSFIKEYLAERAFVMSRKDAGMDVDKIYTERVLHLPQQLETAYQTIEREMILEWDGIEIARTMHTLPKFNWLRQMCGGFVDGKLVWNGKVEEIKYLLETELKDESVVILCNFRHEVREVHRSLLRCTSTRGMAGDMAAADRRTIVADFQKKRFKVLVSTVDVVKTGENLSVSDTLIYYGPPAGTEAWLQSQDRILDIAQEGSLFIINLVVANSVDTDCLEVLKDNDNRGYHMMRRIYQLMQQRHAA